MICAPSQSKFLILSISVYLFLKSATHWCVRIYSVKDTGPDTKQVLLSEALFTSRSLWECRLHFEICFVKNIICRSQACGSEFGLIGIMKSSCVSYLNVVMWRILYFLRPWDDLLFLPRSLLMLWESLAFLPQMHFGHNVWLEYWFFSPHVISPKPKTRCVSFW